MMFNNIQNIDCYVLRGYIAAFHRIVNFNQFYYRPADMQILIF